MFELPHSQKILSEVCNLAISAGAEIMKIYMTIKTSDAIVHNKDDGSPLTLADLAAHRIIVSGLTELTPNMLVVSEENKDSWDYYSSADTYWLVDPLDGSKEFLSRTDEFTVNIALIINGHSRWGVIYAPALQQLYWGGRGLGSVRREKCCIDTSLTVDKTMSHKVIVSRTHLNQDTIDFIERMAYVDLVKVGSSLKFCRIAEGLASVYPRLAATHEWDTAAGHAIVEGAGGWVYDCSGMCLKYGKAEIVNPNFIASSRANLSTII